MNKIFLILLISIFVLGGINATGLAQICIDLDPPSLLNSSLTLTATNNNINLNWIAATDIPDCSGIDYYEIYKSINGVNFSSIVNTSDTTYTDTSLSYGKTYYYMIHVFDLVGHNEGGEALSNSLYLSSPTNGDDNGDTPGGGGGGNDDSYWQCGEWGECINGTQERICVDLEKDLPNRSETKECLFDFVPIGQENNESEIELIDQETTGSRITGAVIDFAKSGTGAITLIVIILIIGIGIIILRKK